VTIFINDKPYQIERASGQWRRSSPKSMKPRRDTSCWRKNGPPLPLAPDIPVKICGCEIFHSQVQAGGSS